MHGLDILQERTHNYAKSSPVLLFIERYCAILYYILLILWDRSTPEQFRCAEIEKEKCL